MVAADLELHLRVERGKVVDGLLQLSLHAIHVLLALLNDGEGYRPFALSYRFSLHLLRHYRHAAYLLQLQQAVAFPQVDVLDILWCTQ